MTSEMFVDAATRDAMRARYEAIRVALPIPTESRLIETPFGETHVLLAGPAGAPPLVALHGAMASSALLMRELAPMTRSHRVIAVDVLGQSAMSADRRVDVRDDAYGRWLEAVVEALDLDRFALLGVSWGGFVAREGALRLGSRLDGLILMVPAGFVSSPPLRSFKELGWPLLRYSRSPSERNLDRLVSALFTHPDPVWRDYMGAAFQAYRLDMRVPPLARDLFSVRCPTLAIAAERDVAFPGDRLLARIRELIPQAETELIAGARHSPPTTDVFREWLAERIERFLAVRAPVAR